MSGEAQLLLMIAGLHVLGLAGIAMLMIPALRAGPDPPVPPDSESDEGWGRGRPPEPQPPEPPRGGIPLPDAEPPRARLREPGRFWDQRPARERRPTREPARSPVRIPAHRR